MNKILGKYPGVLVPGTGTASEMEQMCFIGFWKGTSLESILLPHIPISCLCLAQTPSCHIPSSLFESFCKLDMVRSCPTYVSCYICVGCGLPWRRACLTWLIFHDKENKQGNALCFCCRSTGEGTRHYIQIHQFIQSCNS